MACPDSKLWNPNRQALTVIDAKVGIDLLCCWRVNLGESHEQKETDVSEDESGASCAGGSARGQTPEGGDPRPDQAAASRAGLQSKGFRLSGRNNEEAAADHARQQAGKLGDISKAHADKERDAVPFSLAK